MFFTRDNTDNAFDRVQDFQYDGNGQLTDADDSAGVDFDYAFDDAWNLDYRKEDGATKQFSVNNRNHLTSSPTGTHAYDYNGNMTSVTLASGF